MKINQQNQLWHEKHSKKILQKLKKNGELQAFKKDIKAEKHGKKLFNLRNAY